MHLDDLSPGERFSEIAAILATGVLRLKSRPMIASESAVPASKKAADSSEKPLEYQAEKRLHVLTG